MKTDILRTIIITLIAIYTICPISTNAQTCADEGSEYAIDMLEYFISNSAYEPMHELSGLQNMSITSFTRLESLEHEELCNQLMQTTFYINAPSVMPVATSFFKTHNRRLITFFFLDSLPSDDGLTIYTGPIGIIDVLDENLNHVHSILVF